MDSTFKIWMKMLEIVTNFNRRVNGQGVERNANHLGKFLLKLGPFHKNHVQITQKATLWKDGGKCLNVKDNFAAWSKYK